MLLIVCFTSGLGPCPAIRARTRPLFVFRYDVLDPFLVLVFWLRERLDKLTKREFCEFIDQFNLYLPAGFQIEIHAFR